MFWRSFTGVAFLTGGLLFAAGCGGESSTPAPPAKSTTTAHDDHADNKHDDHKHDDHKEESAHGHSHERGKMLIADAGPYHALLTAHLSKDGNELDIFFETPVDKDPQPAAIAVESFEAQAKARARR